MLDRFDWLRKMNETVKLDLSRTAAIQIDMHARQIHPEWSGFPQNVAERILPNAANFLKLCRSFGLPVIHVMVYKRDVETLVSPRQEAVKQTGLPGTPYGFPKKSPYVVDAKEGYFRWDVMPILGPEKTDYVINTKRQLTSSFLSTDLENLIRALGVDTFLIVGINTNNCCSNFAFDIHNRGMTPIMISDCVGSVHGKDLHEFALHNIARTLGFVMHSEEAKAKLEEAAGIRAAARGVAS